MSPEPLVRSEYVESTGQPGTRNVRLYHRFHLPAIDAWGAVGYRPGRHIEMFGGGHRYATAYLAWVTKGMREGEARSWMRRHRTGWWTRLEIPDNWLPPEDAWL